MSGEVTAMNVTFPSVTPRPGPGYGLLVAVERDGELEDWHLTFEALRDHFGATSRNPRDLIAAYIAGKPAIQDAIRRVAPYRMNPMLVGSDFEHSLVT